MRPTALGLKALGFYGLLTVAFYVSPYTNLFFLLLSFFAALVLLGAWWARWNVRCASARVIEPRPMAADIDGGRIDVEFRARRACVDLEVELMLEGRKRPLRIANADAVTAGQTVQVIGRLPALHRGVHRVQSAHVRSSAPLGLWWASVPAQAPAEVVVHPAPLDPVHAREAGIGEDGDDHGRRLIAHGDAGASGLRSWRTGDQVRMVHWRATARRRAPVVREFDTGSHRGLAVWLDRRCTSEELDRALSALVTLALRASERDCGIEVRTQGLAATYGAGHEPIDALLRWTATAQAAPADDAPPPALPDSYRLPIAAGRVR